MSEKFDAPEMASKMINDWLQKTRGLPITLQLTKLGFAVIEGLEKAFELGRLEGKDQLDDEAYWEHIGDEISGAFDEPLPDSEDDFLQSGEPDFDDDDTNEFHPF